MKKVGLFVLMAALQAELQLIVDTYKAFMQKESVIDENW
jgi:hypothetical protein